MRFPLNTAGRDFVIPDIHGSFQPVVNFMRRVGFKQGVDRLYSCGDTVDRGPEPERAARFVQFAHTVRGNHEDFFLELRALERGGHDAAMIAKVMHRGIGCGWYASATEATKASLEAAFLELPIAIEVETSRGLVGIVHADVPEDLSWPQFLYELGQGNEEIIALAIGRDDRSRNRIHGHQQRSVAGIGRVYVGHTIVDQVERLGNIYALDTGSYAALDEPAAGYRLTAANMIARTSAIMSADVVIEDGVHLIDEVPEENIPFTDFSAS